MSQTKKKIDSIDNAVVKSKDVNMDEKTVKFTLKRKIKLKKLKQDVKKARRYFQSDDEENNKPIYIQAAVLTRQSKFEINY